jgi:hypothetical protein
MCCISIGNRRFRCCLTLWPTVGGEQLIRQANSWGSRQPREPLDTPRRETEGGEKLTER